MEESSYLNYLTTLLMLLAMLLLHVTCYMYSAYFIRLLGCLVGLFFVCMLFFFFTLQNV